MSLASGFRAFVVHIDGLRERHDESVCKEGMFDEAVEAIRDAKRRGFKVFTNTTFFNTDTPQTVIDVINYLNDELGIDQMEISPEGKRDFFGAARVMSRRRRCRGRRSAGARRPP